MPLTWTISHEEKMISARAEGTVRYRDVATFLEANREDGVLSYRKLFDARTAASEFGESDLNNYVGAFSGYNSLGPFGPLALVVGPLSGAPQRELFQRLSLSPRPLGFFTDMEEARGWLLTQHV